MAFLHVSEIFYSLQCEGRAIGTPAVFLRLTGCNLNCPWCDTTEVWRKGVKTAFNDVLPLEYIGRLSVGAHLVITGGEPMLQQAKIESYLDWFQNKFDFLPCVEIETNGTVLPNESFKDYVDYWNVSPKLKNSQEKFTDRVNEIALGEFNSLDNAIFKFVISSEDDILEILQDYEFIDWPKFVFMPLGSSRNELDAVRLTVAELAIKYGVRYSERLHIVIWNQKTGV